MPDLFAIADLHLSRARPKPMDVFGGPWEGHPEILATRWRETVSADDLVLIPGDISWAMGLDDALADLEWIDELPGRKVLAKGNHDYWWSSITKLRKALPPSFLGALQYDAMSVDGLGLCGTRLWDAPSLDLEPIIDWDEDSVAEGGGDRTPEQNEKVWRRELGRLERSLADLPDDVERAVCMVHYPPVDPEGEPTEAAEMIEADDRVTDCVFGHVHSIDREKVPTWDLERNGVRYRMVACDFVEMTPVRIGTV